jgi:hypothetical protein
VETPTGRGRREDHDRPKSDCLSSIDRTFPNRMARTRAQKSRMSEHRAALETSVPQVTVLIKFKIGGAARI